MKAKYSVKSCAKLPAPPIIKWALYMPKKKWENFFMYSSLGHAKSAVTSMYRSDAEGARLFEWVDGEWVERSFEN